MLEKLHNRSGCKWTQADYELLQDMWGEFSLPTIAKRLGRSVNAINIKVARLGLGSHIQNGSLISFCELLKAIGQYQNYSYLKTRLPRDGFPVKRKRVNKCSFLMVDIDDFWEWTEKNKDAISFVNFEEFALGAEPNWVKDKRKADYISSTYTKAPWSEFDDARLKKMLNDFKYGYAEISATLRRTEGAIKRRMLDLGLKQRPLRANIVFWTADETATLQEMRQKGCGYEEIGLKLGRSALSCRAKMDQLQKATLPLVA